MNRIFDCYKKTGDKQQNDRTPKKEFRIKDWPFNLTDIVIFNPIF